MEGKNNQVVEDPIIEIKKEIEQKINEMGYQEYRLSQQEKLRQFIKKSGWATADGDKLLEEAEDGGKDEQ